MSRRLFTLFAILVLYTSLVGQIRIGIDAEPFLNYAGNAFAGQETVHPQWQGPQGIPLGIDIARYRHKSADWMRYRLFLSYHLHSNRSTVNLLDDALNPIPNQRGTDKLLSNALQMSMSVEREKYMGQGRLQGILGRGLSGQLSRDTYKYEVSNPLGAYLGDTLWSDSGYQFGFGAFVYTGVKYEINQCLSLMARLDYGLMLNYYPEQVQRMVVLESGDSELVQRVIDASSSSLQIDGRFRPRLVLSMLIVRQPDETTFAP